MGANTRANGKKTKQMEKVNSGMPMVMSMKAIGLTTKLTVMGCISMLMGQDIWASGKKTSKMGKELNNGQMEANIKASIWTGRNMDMERTSG